MYQHYKYVSTLLVLLTIMSLTGCQMQPSDTEVLQAVNRIPDQIIRQALVLTDNVALYDNVNVRLVRKTLKFEHATVNYCDLAEPQEGYFCNINLATEDIMIIGSIPIKNITLRFKQKHDGWYAYIL